MSRMPPLDPAKMTEDQKTAAEALAAGPRGGVKGPFIALLRSPQLMDRRPDALQQLLACFRQGDIACVPIEQTHADAFFEAADHLAQGRRGDAEFLGRATEVSRLCHGDEVADVSQVHARSMPPRHG